MCKNAKRTFNMLQKNSEVFADITNAISAEYGYPCTMEVFDLGLVTPEDATDGKFVLDECELDAVKIPTQRVQMHVHPGPLSHIRVEVWLPVAEKWNGILLGMGSGGGAGYMNYGGLCGRSSEGYVAVYSDLGTSKGTHMGENNNDMWCDFGGRANHVMTVAAKLLIEYVYGCKQEYAYFEGGSTGGQQALREAQMYPLDYDGIIAAVPAHNRTYLHTYFLWGYQHLYRGEDVRLFSNEEIDNIYNTAVAYFKRRGDEFPDVDFICMPTNDENTITDILDEVRASKFGLTDEQYAALKAMYEGPTHALTGEKIYDGVPFGGEYCWCGINTCQTEINGLIYPFKWAFGNDYDVMTFDFGADFDALNERVGDYLNANDPNLAPFFNHGGKLIMFSGSADACVPYHESVKYYSKVLDCCGGHEQVDKNMKYYVIPGREHGWNGHGVNAMIEDGKVQHSLLNKLRDWRENDKDPGKLHLVRVEDYDTPYNDCLDDADEASLEDRIVFRHELAPYKLNV